MPTPRSPRRADALLQRVDRIRRARNACELQRAAYLLVAVVLAGAMLLLVTALFGSTRLFAVLSWSTGAAVVVTSALLVREAAGRWLSCERTVGWIEERAALRGRLRSLVELGVRGDRPGTRFFLPLLRAENERVLPAWEPNRIVPQRVPRVALALALLSTFALLASLTLTPVLYPRVPELAGGAATTAVRGMRGLGDAWGEADIPSPLARLPAVLQERIRQAVWGAAWDRVREALARTRRSPTGRGDRRPFDGSTREDATEGPWQLAERARPHERTPESRGRRERAPDDTRGPTRAPERTLEHTSRAPARNEHNGAGGGAGTGTSPDLYGAPAPPELASRERFELGLVTRMRLKDRHGGPGATAPARGPDQDPALAPSDRAEELGHEMPVPRAYEPIVRQVFAHRAQEGLE